MLALTAFFFPAKPLLTFNVDSIWIAVAANGELKLTQHAEQIWGLEVFKSILTAGFAAAFSVVALTAQSATLSPPYTGVYDATSVNTGGNLHTIWLSGVPGSDYFQFVGGSGEFSWLGSSAGDTATLTGTIAQNGAPGNMFEVSLEWAFKGVGGAFGGPKCEGSACADNDTSKWGYFDLVDGTLTGINDLLGLTLALTQIPADGSFPMQLGYGANGKSPTSDFGLSMWFSWLVTENTSNFAIATTGHGDVNLELTPVPIPAALPLFASALGGMGFFGWRRKRKVAAAA